jgi:fucose 4-O-acetylase-like acetyltransferase
MANQRIAYIDAMRGFTMILVVYAHVCYFCMDGPLMGYNRIFYLFRLPCFFMISGWLFEPVAKRPFKEVVRHKAMVQLLPTFIFLLLLAPPPEFFHQLGTLKGGYWFTFVLFEFFVIYSLLVRIGRAWRPWLALVIALVAFFCARYYNTIHVSASGFLSLVVSASGFMSVTLWRFFLFFYIGAWMRRHFEDFIQLTNHPWALPVIAIIFILIASTPHKDILWYEMLRFFVGGVAGMWMVFTCFRLSESWLNQIHLSKPLQYVGTRTLDVYLLHYFFLPRFLIPYADLLRAYDNQFMEFLVILAIAFVVLAITLLASFLIRLSPFLGHYLFGVKCDQNK